MKKLVQVEFESELLKKIDDYRNRWEEINRSKLYRSDFIKEACKEKLKSVLNRKDQIEMDMRRFSEEMDENAFQHSLLIIVGMAFSKASHDKEFDLAKALKGLNLRKLVLELFKNENLFVGWSSIGIEIC